MAGRCRLSRFVAVLLGAWVLVLTAGATTLRPCTMHTAGDDRGHASHGLARTETPLLATGDHTGHDMHAGSGESAETPTSPAPGPSCDCETSCCALPGAGKLLPALSLRTAPVRYMMARHPVMESASLRPVAGVRLLPFANGPPSLMAG